MLEYLYTQAYTLKEDYEEDLSQIAISEGLKYAPRTHISLYTLGDKYGIPTLCHHATDQLRAYLDTYNDTEGLLRCLSCIYDSTPPNDRTLRKLAIQKLHHHCGNIRTDQEHEEVMISLVHDFPELREDILLAFLRDTSYMMERYPWQYKGMSDDDE